MSTYIIGDVHGCYSSLLALLEKIDFNPDKDHLIFVGDLINRGHDSIGVLRFVHSLGNSATVVLGNHDISFIAYMDGVYHGKNTDFPLIARSHDSEWLCEWLRQQPLIYVDETKHLVVVHAAIPPQWTLEKAVKRARKGEKKLAQTDNKKFLRAAFRDGPDNWQKCQSKKDKFRYTLNGLTRLRYCNAKGALNLQEKGPIQQIKTGQYPWFDLRAKKQNDGKFRIVFGHWAALGYYKSHHIVCIDSGCVWGGKLTALKVTKDDFTRISQKAK